MGEKEAALDIKFSLASVETIAARFMNGESARKLAKSYEVSEGDIESAIRYVLATFNDNALVRLSKKAKKMERSHS